MAWYRLHQVQREMIDAVLADMGQAAPLDPADRNSSRRVVGAERVRSWQKLLLTLTRADDDGREVYEYAQRPREGT